tara:strand:+ start:161 stop:715 length:555 start_codon:yes stop_codon:yes gene_type:complete
MIDHPNWLVYEEFLDKETCERWIEAGKKQTPQKAKTFDGNEDQHRKTQIRWLNNDGPYQEMHNVFKHIALDANQYFQTTLSVLPPLQFTEYSDVGYKYDMHHDVNWNRQDGRHRKLSIVVQLTDPEEYEGGILSFAHTQNPDPTTLIKQGTIICFLSYLEHGVTPITKGSRTSLVGWFEGPYWR